VKAQDIVWVSNDGRGDNYSGRMRVTDTSNPPWVKGRSLDKHRYIARGTSLEVPLSRIALDYEEPVEIDPVIATTELKDTNPKDAVGSDKLPLHLWPETATVMGSLGLLDGMLKYGRSNWRVAGVRATIYIDAVKRHINAYAEGENTDPDSGLPHLSHALACLAILVDAQAAGKLTDDRSYPGGYRELVEELTPHVSRLKEKHKDKSPKHYTIADA
jgi:hypothetical protein